MFIDLSPYSKILKILAILPFVAGLLLLAEHFLPLRTIETTVVSFSSSHSKRGGEGNYTIYFEGINDQVTMDLYNRLHEGDSVTLHVTAMDPQIRYIEYDGELIMNDTNERFFQAGFIVVFLLAGLSWLKKGWLRQRPAFYLALDIVFGIITLTRIILA